MMLYVSGDYTTTSVHTRPASRALTLGQGHTRRSVPTKETPVSTLKLTVVPQPPSPRQPDPGPYLPANVPTTGAPAETPPSHQSLLRKAEKLQSSPGGCGRLSQGPRNSPMAMTGACAQRELASLSRPRAPRGSTRALHPFPWRGEPATRARSQPCPAQALDGSASPSLVLCSPPTPTSSSLKREKEHTLSPHSH